MAKKVVWLINQYASTPETGMGGRHFYLARELARQGYEVYVIAASFTHLLHCPKMIKQPFEIEEVDGFKFVWVKMPHYQGAHNKKRVLNWFLFAWRLLKLPRVISRAPDVIVASSPSLILFLSAQRLARKLEAKLVFEVRDIWPLTLIKLGNFSVKHPFIAFLQWIENRAYRDADCVISNLPNAKKHMVAHGLQPEKFHWIANGYSQDEIENKSEVPNAVFSRIPKNKFIVGYTGTLGVANAIDSLVDAMERLWKNKDVHLVLVGDGKEKERLISQVERLGLDNVTFIEPIAKSQIQSMLAYFDVCYVGAQRSDLYEFGVAPNKLFDYLIAGRPVIYSIDSPYSPTEEGQCGFHVSAENPEAIADAILKLQVMQPSERSVLGKNAKCYAQQNFDYLELAKKFSRVLFS